MDSSEVSVYEGGVAGRGGSAGALVVEGPPGDGIPSNLTA